MARLQDLREIMLRHGDGHKVVWGAEMGWTVRGEGPAAWQTVTEAQQAEYLARAFAKSGRRWPWLKMLAVWNLDNGRDTAWRGSP